MNIEYLAIKCQYNCSSAISDFKGKKIRVGQGCFEIYPDRTVVLQNCDDDDIIIKKIHT